MKSNILPISGIALLFLFVIFYMWEQEREDEKYRIVRTKECKQLGGDEYHFWNDTCYKVIQERKTEEIILSNPL